MIFAIVVVSFTTREPLTKHHLRILDREFTTVTPGPFGQYSVSGVVNGTDLADAIHNGAELVRQMTGSLGPEIFEASGQLPRVTGRTR